MDGYLLDTCTISALLDGHHKNYEIVRRADEAIEFGAPRYVSCVTLAELAFGLALHEAATQQPHPRASEVMRRALAYPILDIGKHTASEYAEIRKNLAVKYLHSLLQSDRPRWIDQWVSRVTGEKLQIDENDLWICAQARERNLTLVTTDEKLVTRISAADPTVKFQFIKGA